MPHSHTIRLRLLALVALLAGAAGASAAEPRGERYALLIGVQSYPPGQLRNLEFPENDVNDLARTLKLGGYPPENVRVLTGTAGGKNNNLAPTAKNIRGELDYLVRQCRKGDQVVIAFAGHGLQYHNEQAMYLCPADVDLKQRRSLIAVDDVYKTLEKCKADLKVLLVDACRNDPLNRLDRGPLDEFESVTSAPKVPPPSGIVALFSCSATQEAMEDRELQHGVFFHYVIEALTGAASHRDAPDEVTLPQLEDYVTRQVEKRVWGRYQKHQEPELQSRGRFGRVPLVKLDSKRPEVKHLRAALAKRLRRDIDGANKELVRAVSFQPDSPDSADVYHQQGRLYYEKDKYPDAIAAYNKALELEPRNVAVLTDRGEAKFLNGDSEGALEDYNEALKIDDRYELAYLRAGVVRHNQGYYDKALANYTEAIKLDRRDARAYYFRGLVWEAKSEYRKAMKDYDQAREINPRNNDYRNRLALMQQELNQMSAAIDNWTKATVVDPNDESAYFYRGSAYASQGRYDYAISDYSRVLRINPKADYALYARGNVYSKRGDNDRARADWRGISKGSTWFEPARDRIGGRAARDTGWSPGRPGPGGGGIFPGRNSGGNNGGGGRRGR